MTTAATPYKRELSKPLAGLVFLLSWAIAIVAWSLAHLIADAGARGFVVDVGIIFASLGFAALFLQTQSSLRTAAILSIIGIALFVLGDLLHITVIVYELRILAPLLALLTPVNKLVGSIRIFN